MSTVRSVIANSRSASDEAYWLSVPGKKSDDDDVMPVELVTPCNWKLLSSSSQLPAMASEKRRRMSFESVRMPSAG